MALSIRNGMSDTPVVKEELFHHNHLFNFLFGGQVHDAPHEARRMALKGFR
jgi:hypothetical protein